MASWQCPGCRTVYPPGVPACPACKAKEAAMAKVSAEAGATHYVAEGDPLPVDLHPDVRLVGPGVPAAAPAAAPEAAPALVTEVVPGPGPDEILTLSESLPVSSVLVDDYDQYPIRQLRDFVRERGLPVAGSKAELVARLTEHDRAVPA